MGVRELTSRISRRFVLILALAQLLLIYAWIVEPNWIEVSSHEAWFKNLPEEFNGLVGRGAPGRVQAGRDRHYRGSHAGGERSGEHSPVPDGPARPGADLRHLGRPWQPRPLVPAGLRQGRGADVLQQRGHLASGQR